MNAKFYVSFSVIHKTFLFGSFVMKLILYRMLVKFCPNCFRCKNKLYPLKLLNASVVIPFHNEHWTTLLRSVHSLINRTPPELLHEIVLADDFSHKRKND